MSIVPPIPYMPAPTSSPTPTPNFQFTEHEKDLIILGVSQIIRVDTTSGATTTFSIQNYGPNPNSYIYTVIRERMANGGVLDLKALFDANSSVLQSSYPQIYNLYASTSNVHQTITASTNYTV